MSDNKPYINLNNGKYKCKLCDKVYYGSGLKNHFRRTHNIRLSESFPSVAKKAPSVSKGDYKQLYYHYFIRKDWAEGLCGWCSNPTSYEGDKKGYRQFCCTRCSAYGSLDKHKETYRRKYGTDWHFQAPDVKSKYKSTCKERYGVDHPKQTEESRTRQRIKFMEKIKMTREPLYNLDACIMMDKLNTRGYRFKHALNGGEVDVLGYSLDGYDPLNNIALEVDEPHHFEADELREKDIKRQEVIEAELSCKFIRIRVDKNNNIINVSDKTFEELLT